MVESLQHHVRLVNGSSDVVFLHSHKECSRLIDWMILTMLSSTKPTVCVAPWVIPVPCWWRLCLTQLRQDWPESAWYNSTTATTPQRLLHHILLLSPPTWVLYVHYCVCKHWERHVFTLALSLNFPWWLRHIYCTFIYVYIYRVAAAINPICNFSLMGNVLGDMKMHYGTIKLLMWT